MVAPADLAVVDTRSGTIVMVAVVETSRELTDADAVERWLPAAARGPLFLYVPEAAAAQARRLCTELDIRLQGLRTHGLQIRESSAPSAFTPSGWALLPNALRPGRYREGGGARPAPPEAWSLGRPGPQAGGPVQRFYRSDWGMLAAVWAFVTVLSEVLLWAVVNDMIFPTKASEEAHDVDEAFEALGYMGAPVFGLVVAVLLYAVPRFRSAGTPAGDGAGFRGTGSLPVVWLGITSTLAVVMMIYPGLLGYFALRDDQTGDLEISVQALRWDWRVEYADSGVQLTSRDALVLPVDQRVQFNITSLDILHSFWVPAFRLKIDAVPGQVNHLYLTPDRLGGPEDVAFRLQCAELCGTGHTIMSMPVRVVTEEEYTAWVAEKTGAAGRGGEEITGEITDVEVALAEFSVAPAAPSARAGGVRFRATNTGTAPHELAVVRTELAPDALPVSGPAVDETQVEVVGRVDLLPAGEAGEATFNLASGPYVLICNVPGHYALGMRTAFTVE